MAYELADAYISLVPSFKGGGRQIQRELDREMGGGRAESTGRSLGSRIIGGIGKAAAVGGGIAGALFSFTTLKKGLDRLTTIQDATTSMTTILGDATKAGNLLDDILGVVSGTPFNLDQFANAGKNLVAFGVDAQKVPGYLTAIGEAAAASGKGAEGVDRVVEAFGKIAAQGKVQLDNVWSISDTGVPALQILANHFGVTTEEMQKMISAGAVPAEEALDALAKGIVEGTDGVAGSTAAFGGSMAALRETFSGALGGLGAATARFGASVLAPFMGDMTAGMTGTADAIDAMGEKAGAAMQRLADSAAWGRVRDAIGSLPELISSGFAKLGELRDRVEEFFASAEGRKLKTETIEKLQGIWDKLVSAWTAAWPAIKSIAESLAQASAAVGISTWSLLLTVLDQVADVLNVVLVPVLDALAKWMKENPRLVAILVGAYTAWRLIQLALNTAMRANPILLIVTLIIGLIAWVVTAYQTNEKFRDIVQKVWAAIRDAVTAAWNWIKTNVIDRFIAGLQWLWDKAIAVKDGVVTAWNLIRDGAFAAWTWLKTNVIDRVVAGFQWVWDKAVAVKDGVVGAWNTLRDALGTAWRWIRDNVINPLRDGFQSAWDKAIEVKNGIVGAWETVASVIGEAFEGIWDGIKGALNTVFGFINQWMISPLNKILDPFGLSIPDLPKLHSGGLVPGRGEKPYMLLGGEAVLNPAATKALGKDNVERLNRGEAMGGWPDWLSWDTIKQGLALGHEVASGQTAIEAGLKFGIDKIVDAGLAFLSPLKGNRPQAAWRPAIGTAEDMGGAVKKWAASGHEKLSAKEVGTIGEDGSGSVGANGWMFPLPRGSYRVGRGPAGHGYLAWDFPAPTGTRVLAPFAGRVQQTNLGNRSYGRYLQLFGGGARFLAAHLSGYGNAGNVARGQTIGFVGSTGNSTGPHLHVETSLNNTKRDPKSLLKFDRGFGVLDPGMNLVYNGTGGPEPLIDPRRHGNAGPRVVFQTFGTPKDLVNDVAFAWQAQQNEQMTVGV